MKNSTQNQRGSVTTWIVVAVVIIVASAIYFVARNADRSVDGKDSHGCYSSAGEKWIDKDQRCETASEVAGAIPPTNQVTIMVPADLATYEAAEVAHAQVGGPDPLPSTHFIAMNATPNTITSDPIRNAAEAAAEYIPTQAGTSSLVVYFKVVNGTAYVLLNMDVNGWAGVSSSIAQVHPIVEKTLLQFQEIKTVKFAPAPGDIFGNISEAYVKSNCPNGTPQDDLDGWHCYINEASAANWYRDSTFGFSFPYQNGWTISKLGNVVTIVTNDSDLRTITITEILSHSVDDSTGKWGTYVLHETNNGWSVTHFSESDGNKIDTPVTPIQTTNGNFPIFSGGVQSGGWAWNDYIVSLKPMSYLLIRGGESSNNPYNPNNDKLLNFVRAITINY